MEWKYTQNETPIATESGDWDGNRSELVVAEDNFGFKYLARIYEGFMDGENFLNWVDDDDIMIDSEIIRWVSIPD